MFLVRVRYGADEVSRNFETQPRLRDVTNDANIKASLGFGDNVRGLVSGVEMNPDSYIPSGALVTLETKANQKAEAVPA